MTRAAAFLDRDGTLIRDRHFIRSPEQVELLPDAASAVRRLNERQIPVVVVTNQSGIARGFFTEAEYELVRARMEALLGAAGARIDATYMCPHHPDFTGPCTCRKPGTLLFHRAAKDLKLELSQSWYVGDKPRDVIPAIALEGHGILVPDSATAPDEIAELRQQIDVVESLDAAVDLIIESAP